jgi:hypothetical protein
MGNQSISFQCWIYALYIYHPYLRNNIVLQRLQRKYFSSSYRRSCSFNIFFSKYNLEVKANKDFEHFSILILNLHQYFFLFKKIVYKNNFQYECKITINFLFRSKWRKITTKWLIFFLEKRMFSPFSSSPIYLSLLNPL